MRTLLWSYLGWRRFTREMSAFEVRRFFSFSAPKGLDECPTFSDYDRQSPIALYGPLRTRWHYR